MGGGWGEGDGTGVTHAAGRAVHPKWMEAHVGARAHLSLALTQLLTLPAATRDAPFAVISNPFSVLSSALSPHYTPHPNM